MLKKLALLVLTLAFLTACGVPAPDVTETPTAKPLVHIKLPMGYIPNIQFAPFYVAVERGYYKDAGIEVEFDYSFETDGVALVGANNLQFGIASGDQVLLARAKGLPIVYAMAWYQKYPVSVISLPEQNIHAPLDLKGQKIGLPGLFGASYIGLRALLFTAGLQESDVTLDSIGYNQVEAFTTKKDPIVVGYTANEPVILNAKGFPLNELRVSDYFQLPSNGIITNEKTIKENPDLLRSFVAATLKGLNDTILDPGAAYDISKKYVANLGQTDETTQKQILGTSIELWRAPVPGYSDPAGWNNMQKILMEMKMYPTTLDLTKAFTNDFLPK